MDLLLHVHQLPLELLEPLPALLTQPGEREEVESHRLLKTFDRDALDKHKVDV